MLLSKSSFIPRSCKANQERKTLRAFSGAPLCVEAIVLQVSDFSMAGAMGSVHPLGVTDDLRARLSGELHRVDWKPLGAHAKRGGLVMVAPELDLLEVGVAVAGDDGAKVQGWMEDHKLSLPTEAQIQAWREESEERFAVLIVQPYVLAQRDFGSGDA